MAVDPERLSVLMGKFRSEATQERELGWFNLRRCLRIFGKDGVFVNLVNLLSGV